MPVFKHSGAHFASIAQVFVNTFYVGPQSSFSGIFLVILQMGMHAALVSTVQVLFKGADRVILFTAYWALMLDIIVNIVGMLRQGRPV